MSARVRANNKGMVATDDESGLRALDHDFHIGNIVPSVSLCCNIPKEILGFFFIGGDDGKGQIFVTLHDAVFDPSRIFGHCAQLVRVLRKKGLHPTVLVLQTDGGPDHSHSHVQGVMT